MRKIKKINGYLVVKFNDREKREYEGTALGEYGVIDAELYTGHLDIDRGIMEYDDAGTLEEAVEMARGLESEVDITNEPPTCTAIVESNDSFSENEVKPQLMIGGKARDLANQIKSSHYPDTDERTAAHELYGYKSALYDLGFLSEDECFVSPDTFGKYDIPTALPRKPEKPATKDTFRNLEPKTRADPFIRRLYRLGLALENDCPENDCTIYRNAFQMAQELDDALDDAAGHPAFVLRKDLREQVKTLREMYRENYAVGEYLRRCSQTGPEIIKAPGSTEGEIADIISKPCPPTIPEACDRLSCRDCWLAWLTTGGPPREKGPSEERTTPGREAGDDTLTEAEQVLQELFRQKCEQGTKKSALVSALATFGRLLEKERHLPAASEAAALERLAFGLYDGSISLRAEPENDGTITVQFIDTIRRANAGRAILKRIGAACYVKSMDLTPLQ